ncbi:MAG: nucleotide exchange factor GrpE [Armatimonadota bacterium]|nr:MAG: nucleotide exchange factor GrpE [Armatimonadota bacterium]
MTRRSEKLDELEQVEQTGQTGEGLSSEDTLEDAVSTADSSDLLAQLEAERARAEEEHQRYLRALADFANYKKRVAEQEARARQFATRELVLKILPIIDDFERALTSAEESQSFEALRDGLVMTLRKLMSVLESEGVQPIEAVGREFDPSMHEAVMRVEDSEHPENTIVHELQKGYTLASEVIRPSRVSVAVSGSSGDSGEE